MTQTRAYKRHRLRRQGLKPRDDRVQPVAVLFILAMIMELVQAFSLMLTARWPIDGATVEGNYCTAQGEFAFAFFQDQDVLPIYMLILTTHPSILLGALYQLGMVGGAVFTTEIAIMTLLAVIRPRLILAHDGKILAGMIAFALVFLPLMTALPGSGSINSLHYGSTG